MGEVKKAREGTKRWSPFDEGSEEGEGCSVQFWKCRLEKEVSEVESELPSM